LATGNLNTSGIIKESKVVLLALLQLSIDKLCGNGKEQVNIFAH